MIARSRSRAPRCGPLLHLRGPWRPAGPAAPRAAPPASTLGVERRRGVGAARVDRRRGRHGRRRRGRGRAPPPPATSGATRCAGRASASTRRRACTRQSASCSSRSATERRRAVRRFSYSRSKRVDGGPLAGAAQHGVGAAGEFAVVREVAPLGAGAVPGVVEPLAGVLGDGFEQPVAHLAGVVGRGHHERLVDEGAEHVGTSATVTRARPGRVPRRTPLRPPPGRSRPRRRRGGRARRARRPQGGPRTSRRRRAGSAGGAARCGCRW